MSKNQAAMIFADLSIALHHLGIGTTYSIDEYITLQRNMVELYSALHKKSVVTSAITKRFNS